MINLDSQAPRPSDQVLDIINSRHYKRLLLNPRRYVSRFHGQRDLVRGQELHMHQSAAAGKNKSKPKAHRREWVQRVPIRVIVIHHNRARRDIRRSKVFHDVLHEKLETRCAIRRCKVQVSLLRGDLTTIISIKFHSTTTTTKTYILQMQNKQPLLVHLIERRPHSEHTHQHKRRHAQ